MSLTIALDAALSGLMAAQRQTALVSRNIANANTPGYVRKEADLRSYVIGGEGRGVAVAGIARRIDAMLQRDSRRESGVAAELQAKADSLRGFTNLIGQPDEERGIANLMTALANAFQRLGDSPENTVVQRTVVSAAQSLTRGLNAMSAEIARQREAADAAIADSVASVNAALDSLAQLNGQIHKAGAGNQDSTDLEDQRDKLLDTLSQELGITYLSRGDGELIVLTSGGTTLLEGATVHPLSFTRSPQIAAQLSYTPGGPGLSGIAVDGTDIAPGSGYAGEIKSGRLAGLFELRDTLYPQAQAQADEIASTLADVFQRRDATVAPGATGLFTDNGAAHDRGDPLQVLGLAGRIAVNGAVIPEQGGQLWRVRDGIQAAAPGAPGDTTQVRAFQGAFEESLAFDGAAGLATAGRLGDYAVSFAAFQGNQRAAMEERAEYQGLISNAIDTQRLNVEGVNVDDELQKLLQYEQSYAAAAQVIQAVKTMMDTLLEIG
jgi:flagellar hook-associated protein 1 FlgK